MFIAVALAIIFTANLPISFALIFVTNPLTMPAIFYGAYKLGAWIIGTDPVDVEFQASWTWFTQSLEDIWVPLVGRIASAWHSACRTRLSGHRRTLAKRH
jgi:uncharacterized protein (DUF2062 family)